ncbi:MFS transporter [Burkholderia sp. Ac-20379]|uniref:MFS transporter n=1 Tax=Burkholderia sp. Ac-20379 TaxID=2703900 RepID=UPI00198267CA|nr:MFS transporter [Burkholderia sp. Ac-20379]MBN3727375.1 MFS transporter [Burkholderia sp. Ac-20379]
MNGTGTRPAFWSVATLRGGLFPWVIALVTGLDYFDNAIFSFFASYIAGGVNASPDELVWSSSSYAMAAVLGILQQQWWIDRVGHRRYVSGCMVFYAAGAVAATLADTSLQLAFARGLQGYFIGPIMGACRILIQISYTPQERPRATRAFLILLLLGTSLAPIVGGELVAHFTWRALFACTVAPALLFGALAFGALPDSGHAPPEERTNTHIWPYVIFAFAQAALQIVMQQVRYQLFLSSPLLILLTAAGFGSLAWFARQQWNHPSPLVRMSAFRQRTFQIGLLLYVFYYYITTSFSYLTSRFLEAGLGYPVENAGRLTGITSLIAASALFVYLRYAKYVSHKKWVIVPGFALAAGTAFAMSRMTPAVGEAQLIVPLLMRGLLLLFIVLPVANLTFRAFSIDDYTHSYRLKNIFKQLTLSFATASVIIVEQHRDALHRERLFEQANPFNPAFVQTLDTLTHGFAGAGYAANEAHALALAAIGQTIARQAAFLTSLDGFLFVAGVALCGGAIAAWQKTID